LVYISSDDVGRNRGGIEEALSQIQQPTLVFGIDSDILYPLSEQQKLVANIPRAKLHVIRSDDGHDGFLLAQEQVSTALNKFLSKYPVSTKGKL
jgi:homoserine O-acetyltransferase